MTPIKQFFINHLLEIVSIIFISSFVMCMAYVISYTVQAFQPQNYNECVIHGMTFKSDKMLPYVAEECSKQFNIQGIE